MYTDLIINDYHFLQLLKNKCEPKQQRKTFFLLLVIIIILTELGNGKFRQCLNKGSKKYIYKNKYIHIYIPQKGRNQVKNHP